MEAICSSETSVATQETTWRHIPEDDTLQRRLCCNMKHSHGNVYARWWITTNNSETIIHSTNAHLWQYVISSTVITSDVMAEGQVFSCHDLTQFCLNETVIIFVILYVHLHSWLEGLQKLCWSSYWKQTFNSVKYWTSVTYISYIKCYLQDPCSKLYEQFLALQPSWIRSYSLFWYRILKLSVL
jgi:hypothetical protein